MMKRCQKFKFSWVNLLNNGELSSTAAFNPTASFFRRQGKVPEHILHPLAYALYAVSRSLIRNVPHMHSHDDLKSERWNQYIYRIHSSPYPHQFCRESPGTQGASVLHKSFQQCNLHFELRTATPSQPINLKIWIPSHWQWEKYFLLLSSLQKERATPLNAHQPPTSF